MPKQSDYDQRNDRIAALLQNSIEALGPDLVANPELAEVLNRMVDDQVRKYDASQNGKNQASDGGLADLIGLGKDAPANLGQAQVSPGASLATPALTLDQVRVPIQSFMAFSSTLSPKQLNTGAISASARSSASGQPIPPLARSPLCAGQVSICATT